MLADAETGGGVGVATGGDTDAATGGDTDAAIGGDTDAGLIRSTIDGASAEGGAGEGTLKSLRDRKRWSKVGPIQLWMPFPTSHSKSYL